jgi:PKD repeat protein
MKKLFLLSLLIFSIALSTNAQTVTTFAGQSGTAAGFVSTVALSSATFNQPYGIVFDASGRMYVTEQYAHRVRMYNPGDGNLYTRAGATTDPNNGFNADYINDAGIKTRFNTPMGMDVDADGNIYIADMLNNSIRKINKFLNAGSTQLTTTYAGEAPGPGNSGTGGYVNGKGTAARFDSPMDVAVDASGNVYVADAFNDCIRKIDASGNVTLLAGTPGSYGHTDGAAASAQFDFPVAVEMESSTSLLVAEAGGRYIRRINLNTLIVSTVAGSGNSGGTDGDVASAEFSSPNGLAVDNFGNIYVSDGRNGQANNIRKISNGKVTTIAGKFNDPGDANGPGADARFNFPGMMAFNAAKDELYVTDVTNHTIRKIDLKPVADFSTFTTTVNVNVEVTIDNKSTGADTYLWEVTPANGFSFTSGTSNTSKTPKITFTQSGSYTIKLTATNVYGTNIKTINNYINVSNTGGGNAPIADFVASKGTPSPNDTVTFTDKSTNNPVVWEWTITPSTAVYVDGTSSSSASPKVNFPQTGIYTVALKVTNPLDNNTKTRANYIYVFALGTQTVTLDELVNVYPNPTTGKITVDLGKIPAGNTLTVAVYDVTGKAVYNTTHTQNPGKVDVNLENQPKGIYFVSVSDGTTTTNHKVLVK